METLFEVRGASRRLSDDFALADVSIALQPGEIVGFVGANGAGKTTVIRAILGLLHLDSGHVRLFGKPFGATAPAEAQRRLRGRIGVVFDTCPFPAELKVKQAIACVAPAFARWDAQRFASLLDEFDIPPKAKVRDLSRGMGMKLQLAVALTCRYSTRQPPVWTRLRAMACSTGCANSPATGNAACCFPVTSPAILSA